MDFVSPIISPIVESLMLPIKKHMGFLVSSTKYVNDMDAKMRQLKDIAREVQRKCDTAVANTEVVPERVELWLEDVNRTNERAQSIETGRIGCFNVSKRYKTGKRSSNILKEIEDLEKRESNIKFTNEKKSLAKVLSTSTPTTSVPNGAQNNLVSRDLLFNDALKFLQPNNETQNMIALCGMGGVGKTTLMEQLKKTVEDSKMFDWVVKVVLGENPNPISLQRAIAEYIREDLSETTRDARADRLRKVFEGMSQQGQKKILIIMDDVWKEVDLKDIGLANPLPNGFKLLFTSRFEYVCTQMGVKTDSIIRVGTLSDAEAETFFFGIVGPFILDGDDLELQKVGEDIVKKCGGLPIALKTIANNLRDDVKDAWKEALSNLQRHDLQDLNDIVHKVFEMSYNNLKNEDDKALFILCGLFPDDFDIHIEDLIRYGWGLQLFSKVPTLAQARRRTNICVNRLIRANLLTKSELLGCVKMHDLVRAFVLSNFSKVKQASIVNHDNMLLQPLTKEAKESYERILIKCSDLSKFPTHFVYSNLSLLILMGSNNLIKFTKDIFEKMENLEVISYENMGNPLLPVTLEHSTKLRTLCLRSCSLVDDLSFIGSLCNLETLSFADCNIRRLPQAIGRLKNLKLLDLTGCVDLCIDDGVFQNLDSLEELYMRASQGKPIRFTYANCEELEKLSQHLSTLELEFFENNAQPRNVCFKKLERFRISIGCELQCDEIYSFRNSMKFVVDCNELRECKISELFEKVEELQLQVNDMIHLEDVSMNHLFSNLRVLHVSKCKDLTYLFTVDMASDLKKLERLTISECPDLKSLICENSGARVIEFKKLNFMYLKNLPNMISLCENLIKLPEMVELKLFGLPNFTSIYQDINNDACTMKPLLKKEVVIPKLEKLDISTMDSLKQIWPCDKSTTQKNNASMLRKIIVRKCDSLMNIFPCNPFPLLNHLEELKVLNCGSIEVLFNIDFESFNGMGEYSCSRLRSIKVEYLGKLKELWRMRGVNSSDIIINGFKGVESIEITECKSFTNIFTPTTTNFDLGALTTYITRNSGCKMKETDTQNMIRSDQESQIDVAYPSYLLHMCHRLHRLALTCDERVEKVVFDMDSPSSRQLASIQPPPLLLPYLKVLKLRDLKQIRHVWKCNWSKLLILQHQPLQFPFQNLTDIYLQSCHKLKYLFSPLMAKSLSKLKLVKINDCNGIEEVISSRDDEKGETSTSTSSHQNTELFPHFGTLEIGYMPCLKSIDCSDTGHDQIKRAEVIGACWSLCQYPTKILIYNCDALSSLIPWYALGQMKRLQELEVKLCMTMMEVFESESINNSNNNLDEQSAATGTTLTNAMLKNITSVVVPQLSNLKSVSIHECDLLQHIFTFSTLESLKQLKVLRVMKCKTIQVIVKEENETSPKVVVFPRLETLKLDDLPNLKGFFMGMNDFRWPSLHNVLINKCPQLIMFTSGQSKTPKLKYIETSLGKYSLECGLNFDGRINNKHETTFSTSSDSSISKGMPFSFHNLTEINIEERDVKTIIPSHALLQLQKLEQITIKLCFQIKEVFEVASEGTKNIGLSESQTIVKIPNLTQVHLDGLYDLKYLWKSTRWLALEFPKLTSVSIEDCYSLKYVFTCSMVGSLVQLQVLRIMACDNIEVIVKEEEECDTKVNEIMLPRLKSLKLECLPSLNGFCLGKEAFSLPTLDNLKIYDCPAVTDFTKGHLYTPELEVIDTTFGKCYVKTHLNSFIKTKQEEGYKF
ncbi:putative P-loop containing nucleoside triphosphate hydrolase, leucine-rich repeat domain superfamily [Helianthus annuus]|nr:putative P-loop containing nucleoside triphosphate hydrolase, leucine-rich repeat domain superfamily [Helianthus annuus]